MTYPYTDRDFENDRVISRRSFLSASLTLPFIAACKPAPMERLRIAVNPWIGYDPLVLLRESNSPLMAEIRVVDLMSNSESMRALRNGLIDAAALSLDESMRLVEQGFPVRIIAVLSESHGADAVLARPGLKQPVDLRGQRVGLESTALGEVMLAELLTHAKLQQTDLVLVHAEAESHAELLKNGSLDAVITFDPMKSQLQNAGFSVIFDSRQIPGEIIDVLVARSDISPAGASTLARAWLRGMAQFLSEPERAHSLLASGTGLTVAQYRDALRGIRFFTPEENEKLLSGGLYAYSEKLVNVMRSGGLLKNPPDWSILLPKIGAGA